MSLGEFLSYSATENGIAAIVQFLIGFAESIVVEWFPQFNTLDPKVKRLLIIALSGAVPMLALLGQWAYSGVTPGAEMVWRSLQAGFIAFIGSQTAHLRKM